MSLTPTQLADALSAAVIAYVGDSDEAALQASLREIWTGNGLATEDLAMGVSELVANVKGWMRFGPVSSLTAAGTVDLGSAATHLVTISGDASITSFGDSATVDNPIFEVKLTGSPLLVHSADLVLPGAENIQGGPGDAFMVEALGEGAFKVWFYFRDNGEYVSSALGSALDEALSDIDTRAAEKIAEVEAVAAELPIDTVTADAGFNAGWAFTDDNGWTTPDYYFTPSGAVGAVVRYKTPGEDWSGLTDAFRIYQRPSWPTPLPTAFLSIASVASSSGRHIANAMSATPPSSNLFGLDTGDIRSTSGSGMTFTKQYAPGPAGGLVNTAVRGQHTTTSGAFIFLNEAIPAGTWRLEVQAQGNAAGTTNVRRGAATALTADTVTDSAWKSLPRDPAGIVSDGVTTINFQVRGDGANTPDLKYDRLQGYKTGEWVDWADQPPKNFHIKKALSFEGSITVDANGEVIMTGGVNFAKQLFAGFPDPTLISDIAVTTMQDVAGGAANTRIVGAETTTLAVDPTINPITNASTFYIGSSDANGQLATGPVNTGAAGGNVPMKDAGPMCVTNIARTGMRGVLVDGMVMNVLNTAHTAFKARLLNWFGNAAGSLAVPGSWIGATIRINQAPTMDMLIGDILKMQDEFAAAWARGGTRNKFPFTGDSLASHGFGAGNAGALFSQGDYGYHARPLPTANRALSGSTYTRMRKRWDFAGGVAGGDTEGIAPTWAVSDRDAARHARAAGNNVIFAADVSFPNDIARFDTAAVGGLVSDYLDWAEDVKTVTGNPLVLWGPCGLQAATSDQLAGKAMFETALAAASVPGGDVLYISNQAQPYYDWSGTHYYDDKHMKYDTAGAGHWLAKVVVHDALSASGLILP